MPGFKHVLCPVDFSEPSMKALSYAAALASWYKARLDLLHVIPSAEEDIPGSTMTGPGRQRTSHDEVLARLNRSLDQIDAMGMPSTKVVDTGRPAKVIVEQARARGVDLILIGTHGWSGLDRLILGSVTERVVRRAHCPVFTVPASAAAATRDAVRFERILCPIDYSPSSRKALEYAFELARQTPGAVTVLHALEYVDPAGVGEYLDRESRERRSRLLEGARARLHDEVSRSPVDGCEVHERVVVNRAYKAILEEAAALSADLIVMGAQGSGGLNLALYGSNTQHVVRASTCPVLTVRA